MLSHCLLLYSRETTLYPRELGLYTLKLDWMTSRRTAEVR